MALRGLAKLRRYFYVNRFRIPKKSFAPDPSPALGQERSTRGLLELMLSGAIASVKSNEKSKCPGVITSLLQKDGRGAPEATFTY